MPRRPGLQGLQKQLAEKGHFKALGEDVAKQQLQRMREQLLVFKHSLEEFALKHRTAIKQDPAFRAQFHKMCANAGVDPLASNKGMWAQLLGLGDFYYELGVQVVEVCLATQPENGGLMDLRQLRAAVQKRRGSSTEAVSEDDIVRAIKQLKSLGGFAIVDIGSQRLVSSVPTELNRDHNSLLEFAQSTGYVTLPGVKTGLGWNEVRINHIIDSLMREQMAMIDDGAADGIPRYYFPCISHTSI
mmetsp:Transcript_30598/g.58962  ORF Transcript_30598/g.58962 Transcript_30598/m.58962 type:complete len:244 (+) Transcript_30598:174-905(+)|eukprot:CAMPEP_0114257658 /NCGR_PEP_ID=MMETSP0058-20121206/18858_1 /TAXON_ID=36894 /ORGANISM="Pyramimonas parkeae, CCMP726" /LENGTH=243 /DNA_ID=CAMNT_0001372415 /DNA_START=142 /DNA_END=873 /DNA_ORIENTATION=+